MCKERALGHFPGEQHTQKSPKQDKSLGCEFIELYSYIVAMKLFQWLITLCIRSNVMVTLRLCTLTVISSDSIHTLDSVDFSA